MKTDKKWHGKCLLHRQKMFTHILSFDPSWWWDQDSKWNGGEYGGKKSFDWQWYQIYNEKHPQQKRRPASVNSMPTTHFKLMPSKWQASHIPPKFSHSGLKSVISVNLVLFSCFMFSPNYKKDQPTCRKTCVKKYFKLLASNILTVTTFEESIFFQSEKNQTYSRVKILYSQHFQIQYVSESKKKKKSRSNL